MKGDDHWHWVTSGPVPYGGQTVAISAWVVGDITAAQLVQLAGMHDAAVTEAVQRISNGGA